MPAGCSIYIGTSGWHYKHWLGDFYPERFPASKMFPWYAREFNTVEINNSFYRLPERKTFENWKALAPPGFIFAVKASRFITHIKRLKDAADSIDLFFSRADPLKSTLGPVLFQLPPNWAMRMDRLEEFLDVLPKRHRFVLEFRDETWCTPEAFRLLRRHNVALCLHDWREMPWPLELTADFTYLRFHGSGSRYGGSYPDTHLTTWAERISRWSSQLRGVYIYFNNDIGGHAVRNAQGLRKLLAEGGLLAA